MSREKIHDRLAENAIKLNMNLHTRETKKLTILSPCLQVLLFSVQTSARFTTAHERISNWKITSRAGENIRFLREEHTRVRLVGRRERDKMENELATHAKRNSYNRLRVRIVFSERDLQSRKS